EGWDGFPLADWISDLVELPAVLGNDADVAGLAEALFGAGKGLSPIFYITIGSGIGGGLIINGEIYRGCGRGAAEIGHLKHTLVDNTLIHRGEPLEKRVSGWGIANLAGYAFALDSARDSLLYRRVGGEKKLLTAQHVAQAAAEGDAFSLS